MDSTFSTLLLFSFEGPRGSNTLSHYRFLENHILNPDIYMMSSTNEFPKLIRSEVPFAKYTETVKVFTGHE